MWGGNWLTLAVGVLLVLGQVSVSMDQTVSVSMDQTVSVSMDQTSQSTHIPSYGIIRSAMAVEKMVTWADGTIETIIVDDKGRIFLNGEETIAVGLHIITAMMVGEPEDSQRANKILDQLQSFGVRFMTIGCMSWDSLVWIEYWFNFWLPKLYSHKMFVMIEVEDPDYPAPLDPDSQYSRCVAIIDMINDQEYADIIFAFAYAWELDMESGRTDAEVEAYLSNLYPRVKEKLENSIIGNVVLVTKHSCTISDQGTIPLVKWSDVPNWDMYPSGDWKAWIDPRLQTYHDQTLPQAEKAGYHIWLNEHGYGGGNTQYPPEMFQYLLQGGGYNDISLICFWCLEWDNPNYLYAAFDMNGDPKQWFLDLVTYIP